MVFKTMEEREEYITGHVIMADLMGHVIDAEASEVEMEDERDSERRDMQIELVYAENRISDLEYEIETLEAIIRELRDSQ